MFAVAVHGDAALAAGVEDAAVDAFAALLAPLLEGAGDAPPQAVVANRIPATTNAAGNLWVAIFSCANAAV